MSRAVGVRAVFDVSDFEKGLNAYISGLSNATTATDTFATKVQASINQAAGSVNAAFSKLNTDLSGVATQIQTAATSLQNTVQALQTAANTATSAKFPSTHGVTIPTQTTPTTVAPTNVAQQVQQATAGVTQAYNTLNNAVQTGNANLVKQASGITTSTNAAFGGITNAVKTFVTNTLTSIQTGLKNVLQAFLNFNQGAQQAQNQFSQNSSNFAIGFAQGIGQAAVQLLQNAIAQIKSLVAEGFRLVAFFENFNFLVESSVANDLRKASGYTLSMSDALAQGSDEAKGFGLELQRLAIFSKFTYAETAAIGKMGFQYGQNTQQALRLSEALIDVASARGLDAQQVASSARALGQILTYNKVYASELRELGTAGIDLENILIEEGVATRESIALAKQRNEAIAEGSVAVEAFLRNTEKNYTGAAERASKTIQGMVSTLEEVRQTGFREIFGGIFEGLRPILEGLVNFAVDPTFIPTLKALGDIIGKTVAGGVVALQTALSKLIGVFTSLNPSTLQTIAIFVGIAAAAAVIVPAIAGIALALSLLGNPIVQATLLVATLVTTWVQGFDTIVASTKDILYGLGSIFGGITEQAFQWGANIIESFANGMASAVGVVYNILSALGDALTYLLAPGSPPRLVPELDTWGTEAAEVYLEGWTQADFGILDKIGSYFQSFFNSLASQGDFDKKAIPDLTNSIKEQVAQAIAEFKKFGQVSAETFASLNTLGGPVGDILTQYVDRYTRLSSATDMMTAAQDKLNSITKKYSSILKPLQAQLNSIQNIRQNEADDKRIATLQRIVNNSKIGGTKRRDAELELQELILQKQIRNTTFERDKQTDVVQTQLDLATEQQTAIQKEFDLFQARIDQQAGFNSILAQGAAGVQSAMQGVTKAAKEGLTELEKQLKSVQLQRAELADMKRAFELNLILEDKSSTAAEKKAAQLELQEISLRRQQRILEANKLGITLPDLSGIEITLDDVKKKSDEAFSGLGKGIEGAGTNLNQLVKDFNLKVEEAQTKFSELGKKFEEIYNKVRAPFILVGDTIKEVFRLAKDFKLPSFSLGGEGGGGFFDNINTKIMELTGGVVSLNSVFSILGITLARKAGLITIGIVLARLAPLLPIVAGGFSGLLSLFTGPGLLAALKSVGIWLLRIGTSTNAILLISSIATQAIIENWYGVRDAIGGAISGLLTTLDRLFATTIFTNFGQGILDFFTNIDGPLGRAVSSLKIFGSTLFRYLTGDASFDELAVSFEILQLRLLKAVDAITGPFKGAWEFLKNAFFAIKDFFTFDSVGDAVGKLFIELPALVVSGSVWLFGYIVSILPNLLSAAIQILGFTAGKAISVVFGAAGEIVGIIRLGIIAIAAIFSESAREILFEEIGILFGGGEGGFWSEVFGSFGIASESVNSAWDAAWTQIKDSWRSSWETIFKPALAQVATDIANGLFDGIQSVVDAFGFERMSKATQSLIDSIKKALGIASPSTVMKDEIGEPAGQGILDGILEWINTYTPEVVSVAAGAIITGFEKYLGSDELRNKVGAPTGQGLLDGIKQHIVDFASDTAIAIKDELLRRFWAELGIASPSSVFSDEVGKPIGQGILEGIATWITESYQTVVGAAYDLGASIIQGVMDGFSSLASAAKSLYDSTVGSLISGAKNLFGGGDTSVSTEPLTQGISEGLANLNKDELVGVFSEAILAAFTSMKGDVVGVFTAMGTDAVAALTSFKTNAEVIVNTFVLDTGLAFLNLGTELVATVDLTNTTLIDRYTTFSESLTGDEGIVNKLTTTVVEFFDTMGTKVVAAVDDMVAKILEAFTGDEGLIAKLRTDFVDKGNTLGLDFVTGIEEAILDNIDKVADAAKKVAKEALKSGSEEMEAASPSKRAAREIGKPFVDGITQGILGGVSALTKNTGSVIENLFGIASAVESRMGASPLGSTITNNSQRVNNYNLNVNSSLPSAGVVRDFGIMQTLAG